MPGKLLVIGGAESHDAGDDEILERFVLLAGGSDAHLVVIATASESPGEREQEYAEVLHRLGAQRVTALRLASREDANGEPAVAVIERASGVFFTGGDQLRITTVLGGTKVDKALHARLAEGMILAGTSAGAAMMSSTMILGGSLATVSTGSVRTGPGMEFLPGVLIDMHFAERGRLNRLLSAIAMFPHELGLGIDENTAILVDGDSFEVLGRGTVTVIDAGQARDIQCPTAGFTDELGGPIALYGAQLHVLPAGHWFDLTERAPKRKAEEDHAY
ncbi:cyanophycinase [Dactylosporangium matsuzakiense]|uniref:Cyanophycinase n=1 Tax=Dactylosporangium matsuzakiense TaxID=53360 RepID=A0A9W6NJU7_9ACTN|nr:cyanophycinase [Dactylosporangium matsuzakiense]UWZ44400.1 cyanophycinase [Dactylosporangium matsuzakiense]GLK99440.1 cyanophycinase [Dactylosporangium matsuzakiense]